MREYYDTHFYLNRKFKRLIRAESTYYHVVRIESNQAIKVYDTPIFGLFFMFEPSIIRKSYTSYTVLHVD